MASVSIEANLFVKDKQLERWLEELKSDGQFSDRRISSAELEQQAHHFIELVAAAVKSNSVDVNDPAWNDARTFLESISGSRALQGFTAAQTARFVFSFKKAFISLLRTTLAGDPALLATEMAKWTEIIDELALHTVDAFQKSRDEVTRRHQADLLELSTPVIKLWEGVLGLPMIGVLDSARTQVVMETLLQRMVDTGSQIAILDITGVPTVDTLVAQYLMKTVTAIRLMGADCIISGIRPQIAQTIVHLGIDLTGITTKATLADALLLALARTGTQVTPSSERK
jgi:rsbT co-antagonist protein RsbR